MRGTEGPIDGGTRHSFIAMEPSSRTPAASELSGVAAFDAPAPLGSYGVGLQPNGGVFAPSPSDRSSSLLSFASPPSMDPRIAGSVSDRESLLVFEESQFSDSGHVYSEDASGDPRARLVALQQMLADERAQISPLDGARSRASGSVAVNPDGDGQRQGSIGFAVVVGQSAETEATFGSRSRTVVGKSVGVGTTGENSQTDGYHGAFGELARSAIAGWSAVASSASDHFSDDLLASVVDDLLTPRFTCDAAALSVAIGDIATQVDELGVRLLEMLSDPVVMGETALVAGLVGAGLAYRHRRGERAEEAELLSSRFIRGHASLRLAGGGSS